MASPAEWRHRSDRPTAFKERFLARHHAGRPHHLLRVDRETCKSISRASEDALLTYVTEAVEDCDAVLVADYGKGVCTARLLDALRGSAHARPCRC